MFAENHLLMHLINLPAYSSLPWNASVTTSANVWPSTRGCDLTTSSSSFRNFRFVSNRLASRVEILDRDIQRCMQVAAHTETRKKWNSQSKKKWKAEPLPQCTIRFGACCTNLWSAIISASSNMFFIAKCPLLTYFLTDAKFSQKWVFFCTPWQKMGITL